MLRDRRTREQSGPWAAAALLLVAVLALPTTAAARRGPARVRKYNWHVTLSVAAPDCFERPVILVNGQFNPTIKVTQGEILQLTVHNHLPESYPSVHEGISIHFHGLRMKGYSWYDGVGYVQQCPIRPGKTMTYRFQVNDPPGTYLWHGHNGADRVDGLTGPLIVKPRGKMVVPVRYDAERTIFLNDWWHTEGGALAMSLNRPFDSARKTNDSGGWVWASNPQAILINGRGYYADCAIGAAGSTAQPNCSVDHWWVPPGRSTVQPWASSVNPGCSHTNITVEQGKTYLIRIISAASLVYQTLCFEGHNVTIVAADAMPVEPFQPPTGCVDVNSGQRYDVLLTADQPRRNYWITSLAQYRSGSPAGYAVLRYKRAKRGLPTTTPPQPGSVAPWTVEEENKLIKMSSKLLNAKNKDVADGVYREAMSKVPEATLELTLNITQPLMKQTGQLRWALNNVAGQRPNPCQALMDLVYEDPKYFEKNLAPAKKYNRPNFNSSALGIQEAESGKVDVFLTTKDPQATPPPIYPTAGTHILPVKRGEVVELVLQNLNANANNGDYRPDGVNRTAQEQHPFHLHGHSFWVLGQGLGVYSSANSSMLNTRNPPMRDTVTLPQGGWVVLRFEGNNPGMWILHCHLLWHEFMGQLLFLAEDLENLPRRPNGLPSCPRKCTYNAAPWTISTVEREYGKSGFQLPASG